MGVVSSSYILQTPDLRFKKKLNQWEYGGNPIQAPAPEEDPHDPPAPGADQTHREGPAARWTATTGGIDLYADFFRWMWKDLQLKLVNVY